MRSFSHALKLAAGGAGLVAALLGTVAAPANAAPSVGDISTMATAPSTVAVPNDLPNVGVSAVPVICFTGHVQDIGWQAWDCDDDGTLSYAGTAGQGLRLEAIAFVTYNTGGRTCAWAHVQNVGWQDPQCGNDNEIRAVGTTEHSLRMEAFGIGSNTRRMCLDGHVENHGWVGSGTCVSPGEAKFVGSEGHGLRLEGIRGTVI